MQKNGSPARLLKERDLFPLSINIRKRTIVVKTIITE